MKNSNITTYEKQPFSSEDIHQQQSGEVIPRLIIDIVGLEASFLSKCSQWQFICIGLHLFLHCLPRIYSPSGGMRTYSIDIWSLLAGKSSPALYYKEFSKREAFGSSVYNNPALGHMAPLRHKLLPETSVELAII